MTQIYSKRLGTAYHTGSGADVDLFTVPAGHVYVVKTLIAVSWSGTGSFTFSIPGVGDFLPWRPTTVAQVLLYDLSLAFAETEKLRMTVDSHEWFALASGYDLPA